MGVAHRFDASVVHRRSKSLNNRIDNSQEAAVTEDEEVHLTR
jgi:hypothetical protein